MSSVLTIRPSLGRGQLGALGTITVIASALTPLFMIGGRGRVTGGETGFTAHIEFLIAAGVLLIFSLGHATVVPYVRGAGDLCIQLRSVFGGSIGICASYLALLSTTAIEIGLCSWAGGLLAELLAGFGAQLPWWLCAGLIWLCTAALGVARIGFVVRLTTVLLGAVISGLLILDVFALIHDAAAVAAAPAPLETFTEARLQVVVLAALIGGLGFEAMAVLGVRPGQSSRALAGIAGGAFALVALVWLLSGYLGVVGGPVADLITVLGAFVGLLSVHLIAANRQFSLAWSGHLPRGLAHVHPQHGSPWVASLVQSDVCLVVIIAFALCGAGPVGTVLGSMVTVAVLGFLLLLTGAGLATVRFFMLRSDLQVSVFRAVVLPSAAAVMLAAGLWIAVRSLGEFGQAPKEVNMLLIGAGTVLVVLGAAVSLHRSMALDAQRRHSRAQAVRVRRNVRIRAR